jgi:hypothetical protein
MNFIGIDLHKKTISIGVAVQNRRVLKRKDLRCSAPRTVAAFVAEWTPFEAVMGPTASYEWRSWRATTPIVPTCSRRRD